MTRLFVKAALATGTTLELGPEQAHYARRVMRLGAGDQVSVFNGVDGEWLALIEGTGKGRCTLRLAGQTRPQVPEPGPWLAFAPLKKTAMDFVAVKATELGVSRLMAVFTRNTAVRRVNVERLGANAREAAEQCGRLTVPEVAEAAGLEDLAAAWPEGRRLFLAVRGAPPIADILAGHGAGDCGFLVGPEGGFTPSELDVLGDLPFVSAVGLGPRVLRAETLALAALACLQALAGDWRGDGTDPHEHDL